MSLLEMIEYRTPAAGIPGYRRSSWARACVASRLLPPIPKGQILAPRRALGTMTGAWLPLRVSPLQIRIVLGGSACYCRPDEATTLTCLEFVDADSGASTTISAPAKNSAAGTGHPL